MGQRRNRAQRSDMPCPRSHVACYYQVAWTPGSLPQALLSPPHPLQVAQHTRGHCRSVFALFIASLCIQEPGGAPFKVGQPHHVWAPAPALPSPPKNEAPPSLSANTGFVMISMPWGSLFFINVKTPAGKILCLCFSIGVGKGKLQRVKEIRKDWEG